MHPAISHLMKILHFYKSHGNIEVFDFDYETCYSGNPASTGC